MEGWIELTEEKLQGREGINEINRMLRDLYDNMPGDGNSVRVYKGYGSPENSVTAGIGSIYLRLDGTAGATVYKKESGTGATGWTAVSGGGGSGTVTNVSVTTANGVSGTVANPTSTPAITLALGAISPTSVSASGTVTGSNLSGTNTGDQTIPVKASGAELDTGTDDAKFATAKALTDSSYAKTSDITATKLDDFATPDDNTDLNVSTSAHGLCPKITDTSKFLKGDGTWATPATTASFDFLLAQVFM